MVDQRRNGYGGNDDRQCGIISSLGYAPEYGGGSKHVGSAPMIMPSILAWNCRGASSKTSHRHLRELLLVHMPDILILVETRCSSHNIEPIYRFSSFNSSVVSEAHGFSGGIWILWNDCNLEVEVLAIGEQLVTVVVKYGREPVWVLSAIYASPRPCIRATLWDYLVRLS